MHLNNYHFYNPKNYLYSKPTKGLKVFEQGYSFAFNGKEKDDETYGEGNAYDFDARMLDVRLGKFFSIDQNTHKYPWLSPYSAFANNPIIIVDKDGKDNVIYLVVLPSSGAHLTKAQVSDIIAQANTNFKNMGLKTRVVLADPKKFDMSKLSKTDAVAVLGEKKEVTDYVTNKLDAKFGNELKNEWVPGSGAPEKSENTRFAGSENNVIAIDAKAIKASSGNFCVGDEANGIVKFGALSINHGAGHNAGQNHEDEDTGEPTNSRIMTSGAGVQSYLCNPNSFFPKTDSLVNNNADPARIDGPPRNAEYVNAMKKRFGDRQAKYNPSQTPPPSK